MACSKPTTAVGPLGAVVDFREHLPAGVAARAPADAQVTPSEFTIELHGAKVKALQDIANRALEDLNLELKRRR